MTEPRHSPSVEGHTEIDLEPILQVRQMHVSYLAHADMKASFLIACYGTVSGLFIALVLKTSPDVTHPAYYLLGAADFACLLVGTAFLIAAILPRMRSGDVKQWWGWFVRRAEGLEERTPTHFLGILDYSREEFVKEEAPRLCRDREYALERFASQVHVLAGLCKTKSVCVGVGAHLLYVVLFLTALMALIRW